VVDLRGLLRKFKQCNDYEHRGACHMTHVPSDGRLAYLNIIFEAADATVQRQTIDPLGLPSELTDFYRRYNGAHLLSDNLSLYGFFPSVYLYDRMDERMSYPYNIADTNARQLDDWLTSDVFIFGSYGYDRSEVYVEKSTGLITCSVGDDLSRSRATWPSFETWITEEIERMSGFFDEWGNRLVEPENMLPGRRE